jgi:hypothetical protein
MDAETKQILVSICELFKEQIAHTSAVDNSIIALARAILQSESLLRKPYEDNWAQIVTSAGGAVPPHSADVIRQLDEIIRRLKE